VFIFKILKGLLLLCKFGLYVRFFRKTSMLFASEFSTSDSCEKMKFAFKSNKTISIFFIVAIE